MPIRTSRLPGGALRHHKASGSVVAAGLVVAVATLLTACAPGSDAGSGTAAAATGGTNVGTKPVTITVEEASIDVPLFDTLAAEFHAKYKNVTVKVIGQDFNTLQLNVPRIISGTNVPDIIRLGALGKTVADKLVTNLDPYADAYGWDKWPQSQFESTRSNSAGTERGIGSLYGVGPGFGLTGLYYNKAIAARLGMTSVPTSLPALETLLAKAKKAGVLPMVVSGPAQTLAFTLQNLQVDYAGSVTPVQDWNYNKPGADINTAAFVKAATTLQTWAKDGYFPVGVNSMQESNAVAEFDSGTGLFYMSGNWDAPAIDKAGPGKFGFFAFPALTPAGVTAAMSAQDLQVIPAKAADPVQAAAFLNFMMTNPAARQASVDAGYVPGGPANGSTPKATAGSAVAGTIQVFAAASAKNELTEFMVNATNSISAQTLVPETELLVAGKTTPAAFAATVQSDYVSQLSG
jgi:raffinose/stachyose/melibiose transport system substrate-binding protein